MATTPFFAMLALVGASPSAMELLGSDRAADSTKAANSVSDFAKAIEFVGTLPFTDCQTS